MAYIYMRPTADIYVNHTMYPEGSTNGYTLINEEVSDGSATYIGVTTGNADIRVTKSSSFVLAGVDMPLDEYEITGLELVVKYSQPSSGTVEFLSSYTVTSNGIMGVSDVYTGNSSTLSNSSFSISSFDRNGNFLQMFNEYVKANGKTPDVELAVTTHCKSSKSSASFYITQLYLQVTYNTLVYKKLPVKTTTVTGSFGIQTTITTGGWTQAKVYKKTNGVWSAVRNGRSQVGMQLNKIGHELVAMPYKSPTCVETGLTEGSKCSCCGIVYKEQEVVAAKGHTPTTVEASGATCVKDGYTGGERCSVCNAAISGSIIPATGNHTPTDVAATEPTCLLVGYTAGTRCSVCQTYLSGHETIPKTDNHTPTDVAATEPTCGAVGYTAGTQCSVCSKYLSGHEQIPATGNHTYVDNGDGVAETQIDMGLTSRTICSVCGHVLVDYTTIPMLGHTCNHTVVPGYAANCTYAGLTDGEMCTVCGKVFVAQQVIPVNGQHSYVTRDGYEICSVCGYVPSLGITLSVSQTAPLDKARDGLSATSIGNYAIFGGGWNTDATDAYNTSLTKISIALLQDDNGNYRNAAASNNSYAIFACGCGPLLNKTVSQFDVTAYNSSLSRTYPESDYNRDSLAAASNGNYVLFGGGRNQGPFGNSNSNTVVAYNTSLTQSEPNDLSAARYGLSATSVGNYILFGGGNDGSASNIVDTYNTSLTKGTAPTLSIARDDFAATSIGSYALFGGGWNNGTIVNTVDAYNASLTKVSIAALSVSRQKLAATSVGNYALFGGGEGSNNVDIYDKNLTKMPSVKLSSARAFLAATSIGNYALFGGGSSSNTVDAFTVK